MNISVSEKGKPDNNSEGCVIQPTGKNGPSSLIENVGCRCSKFDWMREPTAIVVMKVASSRTM